jgi:hypothetical protein
MVIAPHRALRAISAPVVGMFHDELTAQRLTTNPDFDGHLPDRHA